VTGAVDKPAADLDITVELVRALLAEQHPDLADRPLELVASGWDNAMIRVGGDLMARLPRRELGVALIRHEQRWLPELADRLPLPVPVPVRVGQPSDHYPWPWSIVAYLPGRAALHAPPDDPVAAAAALGGFLRAMHQPAPTDAPENPYRGIPLGQRTEPTLGWIDQLRSVLDAPAVRAAWHAHVALTPWSGQPQWLHGDLHPNNLLVHDGVLSAVIDFGDLTSGDPATDLVTGWMLFDGDARAALRRESGVDDETWHRGRGWALSLGLAYLAHSADDPAFERVGLSAVHAVLADPEA
jgi:aminoglycoside phosphotransferase (APT) family kinase protein